MEEWRKVILASKEGYEDCLEASSLKPSQCVLLIQNDASSFREDLIVENPALTTHCNPPSKRMIHLENRMEEPISLRDTIGKGKEVPYTVQKKGWNIRDADEKQIKSSTIMKEDYLSHDEDEMDLLHFNKVSDLCEEIMQVRRTLTEVDVVECPPEYEESLIFEPDLQDPLQDICSSSPNNYTNMEHRDIYFRPEMVETKQVISKVRPPESKCNGQALNFRPHLFATKRNVITHKMRLPKSKGYRIIQCDKCDKSFKSSDNLRNHIVRSHLTCSICAKTCKTFQELNLHQEEAHNCSVCKKLFISKEKIDRHKKYAHNICTFCSVAFLSRIDLQDHARSMHPLCSMCGLIFHDQGRLLEHEKHHFQCSPCNYLFQSREEKERHLSLHHTCAVCNKLFQTIASLSSHLVAHRTCSICKMEFETVPETINHQRTYHIRCNICSIIFRRNEDYSHHLRQAHQLITPRRSFESR